MTKQDEIIEFLGTDESGGLTNQEIADRIGCGITAVKKAKLIAEARNLQQRTGLPEESDERERRDALMVDILRSHRAERCIRAAIETCKDELKSLKAELESAAEYSGMLFYAADEFHPLFDQPAAQPGGADVGLAADAFRALLSVGHPEAIARNMVELAMARRKFHSVMEIIDAIYSGRLEKAAPAPAPKLADTGS